MRFKILKSRGFTLVELMVTIGIFVFMTAIILARYNTFGSGTILTNTAYDIALTIRQAQTYGLSVLKSPTASDFSSAYGVHFDRTSGSKQFILFADVNTNDKYDSSEEIVIYNLKSGANISGVCSTDNASGSGCSSAQIVDITFIRPNPKATIYRKQGANESITSKYAKITISSGDGSSTREVIVTEMGQIYVRIP